MKIYIFGLGAIGSNLLIQLMKQYPSFEYIGIDYDKIEERNIRTQAYFLEQVGMPKANAIQIVAARFLRKFKYISINKKVTEHVSKHYDLKDSNSLYIDCFDNTEARKFIHRKEDDNVLHLGFSPQYTAELLWQKDYDVPNDVPGDHDICSMNEAISFIHYVVNFSVFGINEFISKREKKNYIITNKTQIIRL